MTFRDTSTPVIFVAKSQTAHPALPTLSLMRRRHKKPRNSPRDGNAMSTHRHRVLVLHSPRRSSIIYECIMGIPREWWLLDLGRIHQRCSCYTSDTACGECPTRSRVVDRLSFHPPMAPARLRISYAPFPATLDTHGARVDQERAI